jgi:hypothetical protein
MNRFNRLLFWFVALLAAAILLFSGYVWGALHWSYSEGERAGTMQKFSSKGWICKTWEGELLMTTVPGAIPEKFEFTVRDEAVAGQMSAAAGKRVILRYAQHKGLPGSCFGDTEYFVSQVQIQSPP